MSEEFIPRTDDGVPVTVGLRVFTNDWAWGTVTALGEPEYQNDVRDPWHKVLMDGQSHPKTYNRERMTTRPPAR